MKKENKDNMAIYRNNKRVAARGITFIDDKVILMKRHRETENEILDYYTLPGGGVEEGESFIEAAIRETMEETNVKTEEISFLLEEDFGEGICEWFLLKYIEGTPHLGGEELEHNRPSNHYEVVLVNVDDIDQYNILGIGKKLIKENYKKKI